MSSPQPPTSGMSHRAFIALCKRSFQLSSCKPSHQVATIERNVRFAQDAAYRCNAEHDKERSRKSAKVGVGVEHKPIIFDIPKQFHADDSVN